MRVSRAPTEWEGVKENNKTRWASCQAPRVCGARPTLARFMVRFHVVHAGPLPRPHSARQDRTPLPTAAASRARRQHSAPGQHHQGPCLPRLRGTYAGIHSLIFFTNYPITPIYIQCFAHVWPFTQCLEQPTPIAFPRLHQSTSPNTAPRLGSPSPRLAVP